MPLTGRLPRLSRFTIPTEPGEKGMGITRVRITKRRERLCHDQVYLD